MQPNNKLLCGASTKDNFSALRIYPVTCKKCIEIYNTRLPLIKSAIDDFMANLPESFINFCKPTENIIKEIKEFRKYSLDETRGVI